MSSLDLRTKIAKSDFLSPFSVLKINGLFLLIKIVFSLNDIRLGDQF